jgi:hypothetical protein
MRRLHLIWHNSIPFIGESVIVTICALRAPQFAPYGAPCRAGRRQSSGIHICLTEIAVKSSAKGTESADFGLKKLQVKLFFMN